VHNSNVTSSLNSKFLAPDTQKLSFQNKTVSQPYKTVLLQTVDFGTVSSKNSVCTTQ